MFEIAHLQVGDTVRHLPTGQHRHLDQIPQFRHSGYFGSEWLIGGFLVGPSDFDLWWRVERGGEVLKEPRGDVPHVIATGHVREAQGA